MDWTPLESEKQLPEISKESDQQPVVIFKHSTTCNISRMMLDRFERNMKRSTIAAKPYLLDLREHRSVSNEVASFFDVEHQSPQMLIIRNGKPIHVSSHFEIDFNEVKSA